MFTFYITSKSHEIEQRLRITMSENNTFTLEVLKHAKLCSENCKHVYENGDWEKMGKENIVYCIGCGRGCHMPCHKIPDAIVNAVKAVPFNNRIDAYFGECSYMRIVCDNCANLLNCNVPPNGKPCFLTLFNNLAKNKGVTDGKTSEYSAQDATQPSRKRKSKDLDEDMSPMDGMLDELKKMMEKCLTKVVSVESIASGNEAKLTKLLKNESEATKAMTKKVDDIFNGLKSTNNTVQSNNVTLEAINTKLDRNVSSIDDGLQKGFNKLADLTEKLCSPMASPRNNYLSHSGRGSSLRKTVLNNNRARNNPNGTPTSRPFGGPSIPTESGAATDEGLFGPAVPRKLDFDAGVNHHINKAARTTFRHDDAIYIRYVDHSISSDKMIALLSRNETIKNAIEQDQDVVEVKRLVKANCTEEEIAKRRFGISYRIGCIKELLPLVSEKSLWANHWEIRPWDNEYGKERNEQHKGESNFRQASSNYRGET